MTMKPEFKRFQARLLCAVALGIGSSFNLAAATFSDANWTRMGSGMNSTVWALAVSGTNLYAGGSFTAAGGTAANGIARWNGSGWSSVGSGVNSTVDALAVSGSDLYAGGNFFT